MTYDERTSKEGTAMNEKSVEQTKNEMPQLQEEHLRVGDFGRTRPLSMSAFPRVDSSMAFERRDDRADCVRDTVNRAGRRR